MLFDVIEYLIAVKTKYQLGNDLSLFSQVFNFFSSQLLIFMRIYMPVLHTKKNFVAKVLIL